MNLSLYTLIFFLQNFGKMWHQWYIHHILHTYNWSGWLKTTWIIFISQPLNSSTKHEKWLQFYDGLISPSNVCKKKHQTMWIIKILNNWLNNFVFCIYNINFTNMWPMNCSWDGQWSWCSYQKFWVSCLLPSSKLSPNATSTLNICIYTRSNFAAHVNVQ